MLLISTLFAFSLALLHLLVGRLRFLHRLPRDWWLAFAGGMAVAYVFLLLLPKLGGGQPVLAKAFEGVFAYLEHHAYLVALIGLLTFFGLQRLAVNSRRAQGGHGEGDVTSAPVFWVTITLHALYNLLIGYLLVDDRRNVQGVVLFGLAMLLHLLVNGYALYENHKGTYQRTGRWVLAGAVLLGWGLGVVEDLPKLVTAALTAFLAGGVLMNVFKEELPEAHESRFRPFLFGAAVYGTVLLLL
jgi:zinc transporter ZupT